MSRREVTEFMIVPPAAAAEAIVGSLDRFKMHLSSEFPLYGFIFQRKSPYDDEEFQVIPMLGTVGEGGSILCDHPAPALIRAIKKHCSEFDAKSSLAS